MSSLFLLYLLFITVESSLLLAAQPVYLCVGLWPAAVLHSLSWVSSSGMVSGGISSAWGRWVPLLSSWGSWGVRLPALGSHCVLSLLLAYSVLGWSVCGCLAAARFRFSLHEYCITTCWVCQVACCRRPQPPGRECTWPRVSVPACCLPLFLVALWFVWGGVWVVVCWAAVD